MVINSITSININPVNSVVTDKTKVTTKQPPVVKAYSNDSIILSNLAKDFPNINFDHEPNLRTNIDITGIDRAISELEKNPNKIILVSEKNLSEFGLGYSGGFLNAGLKFLFGIDAYTNGTKVSARTMANALQASKQSLLAAQGHYDQSKLYNDIATRIMNAALELKPGPEQNKLFDRADKYFLWSSDELKAGDIEVKNAQTIFLKNIGLDGPNNSNPPKPKPAPISPEEHKKIAKWFLTGSSASLLLLLLLI